MIKIATINNSQSRRISHPRCTALSFAHTFQCNILRIFIYFRMYLFAHVLTYQFYLYFLLLFFLFYLLPK